MVGLGLVAVVSVYCEWDGIRFRVCVLIITYGLLEILQINEIRLRFNIRLC